MARIRTIKPEFWSDEKIGTLSMQSRLLYIALWNFSDDIGVLKGSTLLLKAQIFPYDYEVTLSEFTSWFNTLIEKNMLQSFTHKNEQYIFIRNFSTHQKIDKPSKPIIDFDTLSRILYEYSPNTHACNSNSNSSKEIVSSKRIGIEKKVFAPPELFEVFDYFELKAKETFWNQKKCGTEAQKFIDHYTSNGWKVGKNKMTVWRSAASGWINRDKEFNATKILNQNADTEQKSNVRAIADIGNEYLTRKYGPQEY